METQHDTASRGYGLGGGVSLVFLVIAVVIRAEDCNLNGVEDSVEIAAGTAYDCNSNGVPDECDVAPPALLGGRPLAVLGFEADDLAGGDLDGDGFDEVLVLDGERARVFVYETRPDGPLELAGEYATASGQDILRVADVDGDGYEDVLTAGSGTTTVAVLRADRTRGLRAPVTSRLSRPPSTLDLADLDGDGRADLVTGRPAEIALMLWFARADGTFAPDAEVLTLSGVPRCVIGADLDEDGQRDIVVAQRTSEDLVDPEPTVVSVFWAGGGGEFLAAEVLVEVGVLLDLAVADLDAARGLEVLVADVSWGSRFTVLWNRGARRFATDQHVDAGFPFEEMLAFASSGTDSHNAVLLLPGAEESDIRFEGWYQLAMPGQSAGVEVSPVSSTGREFTDACSVDLDRDGDADVLYRSREDLQWLERTRDRFHSGVTMYFVDLPNSWQHWYEDVEVADFDGDGIDDIVAARGPTRPVSLELFWGAGAGTFDRVLFLGSFELPPRDPIVFDADEDGDSDLLVVVDVPGSRLPDEIWLFRNEGERNWTTEHVLTVGEDIGSVLRPVAGDVDGDGRSDVVFHVLGGEAFLVLWNSSEGFAEHSQYELAWSSGLPKVGDIDGDGQLEIVNPLSTPRAVVIVEAQNGRHLVEVQRLLLGDKPDIDQAIPADLDDDSDVDLILQYDADGGVDILEQVSPGEFRLGPRLFEGPFDDSFANRVHNAVVMDVDGDGHQDVVGCLDGDVRVARNRGGLEFREEGKLIDSFTAFAAPGDFDGDGRPDLAMADRAFHAVRVLLNDTDTPTSRDDNRDDVPDECDPPAVARFVRGDVDDSGHLALTDAIRVLNHVFGRGPAVECRSAADANDDGRLNVTDGIAILRSLFAGTGPLPAPAATCAADPTPDDLTCAGDHGCRP